MKIRQRSSSFYFLGELLFVILCFALGSVLCVALDQNQALRLAQPLAEQLRYASNTPLDQLFPELCTEKFCMWQSDETGMPQEKGVYQIEILRQVHNESVETSLRVIRVHDARLLLELNPIKEAEAHE